MKFNIVYSQPNSLYRVGEIHGTRNIIETPRFMPVGTYGAVTALTPEILKEYNTQIIVCNALRLYQKPGYNTIIKFNGIHNFIGWDRTILTDSGGFQSMAYADFIEEKGIQFNEENNKELWTPEKAVEFQQNIGSDFIMPLDICVKLPSTFSIAKNAMQRTIRWAKRCKQAFKHNKWQVLFGIIQGATYKELRKMCIDELMLSGFDAYAIGGLNVGEKDKDYKDTLIFTNSYLDNSKLRYLMGIGRPEKILDAIKCGIDIMDSIIPTRYAREKMLFTNHGILRITRNRKYRLDKYPIDPTCNCYTCNNYSRAFLYHLFHTNPTSAIMYSSMHNVYFCINLVKKARNAILEKKFDDFYNNFLSNYLRKK